MEEELLAPTRALRQQMRDFPINNKPDPNLKRDLEPGFLLPYLLAFDNLTFHRWDYWYAAMCHQQLPEEQVPQIDWLHSPDPRARKMIETTLDAIPRHGSWQSMDGWQYFRYLLEWMLWGFGHPGYEEPKEPFGCEGASMRIYQILNLCAWILWPFDHLGDLLAENAYGRKQGFFPTPMGLCELMAGVLFDPTKDHRTETVCDPTVGTGRLLLVASNYSLRLYGSDIDPLMCMATLVNGYLYCPWLVKPFPFLDGDNLDPEKSHQISDSIAAQAPPHLAQQLAETEHDEKLSPRFEPIKKRRRKDESEVKQGCLF